MSVQELMQEIAGAIVSNSRTSQENKESLTVCEQKLAQLVAQVVLIREEFATLTAAQKQTSNNNGNENSMA